MSNDLQGLLDRIHEKGIKEADSEKKSILEAAEKEAARIVDEAEKKAETIKKDAVSEAEVTENRAKAAISQAARDMKIALKTDLLDRLQETVKECIGEAMTPQTMSGILMEMVKSYNDKNRGSAPGIELILAKKDLEKAEKLFRGSLVENLKGKPELSLGHDLSGGLKIGFKGDDIFFDFSDEALSEVFCNYLGPRIASILEEQEEGKESKKE